MNCKSVLLAAGSVLLWLASASASAMPVTYTASGTGPGSVGVSASAMFDIVGNQLTITLRNTSGSNNGQDVPGSTLTGLFWNFTGNPVLTPMSATVAPGSSIVQASECNSSCAGVTNVGGEFGYQEGALVGGADRGISSSGYLTTGLSHNIGNFNNGAAGANLDDPDSLDGINFGIVSSAAGFNPNGGLASVPLIQDAVIFILSGVSGLTNADISNVSFQYGTELSELNLPGQPQGGTVPEPASVALLGLGLFGLAAMRRRRQG